MQIVAPASERSLARIPATRCSLSQKRSLPIGFKVSPPSSCVVFFLLFIVVCFSVIGCSDVKYPYLPHAPPAPPIPEDPQLEEEKEEEASEVEVGRDSTSSAAAPAAAAGHHA